MRRLGPEVILLGALTWALAGCDAGLESIPAGAQEVHVVITDSEVRLVPDTVRAGDVYLVLDAPLVGSLVFVEGKRTAAEDPGPLSDDDLARLARGDTEGTAISGLDSGGCAEARGKMGHCGNVMKVVLREGKYAIFADMPEGDPSGPRPPMAVVEVVP
jgi:hypothetical protein